MVKATDGSTAPPHPTKSAAITLECPAIGYRAEGTDIEALRKGVFAELDTRYSIKWEPYMKVKVNAGYAQFPGTGITVEWDDVFRGVAYDGSVLMRSWKGRAWAVAPWPGRFTDNHGNVVACIPATEANEEAMKLFASRVDAIREKIKDMLRPEHIGETLALLAGSRMLPFRDGGGA